eukprot:TRINITY_DN71214_c0_g1_i1.p1 TRINITY_DN71214_c0_g1~~TRINITY_DN71214_c0_g1_i1.p1  ORF type:complete len:203 (+),score=32.20 TRINITY_DN71214_c0_g1_i1:94-702(+)
MDRSSSSAQLDPSARWLWIGLALGVFLWIMVFVGFALGSANTKHWSKGQTILDRHPGWRANDVRELFDIIGQDGRDAYNNYHLYYDSWFPFIYPAAIATLHHYGRGGSHKLSPICQKLIWLTLITTIVDEGENLFITFLANAYDPVEEISQILVVCGSFCTILKFVCAAVTLLVGVLGVASRCYSTRRQVAEANTEMLASGS